MSELSQIIQKLLDAPDDQGFSSGETAGLLEKKEQTLATWRSQGRGPRFRKIGRTVDYTAKAIRDYLKSCEREPEPAKVRRQRRATAAEINTSA